MQKIGNFLYQTIYEDIINDDCTIDNINSLLSLYQKAIEFFSAIDSGRFEDFLNRNKRLLSREDVQMVLNSMQTEKKDTKLNLAPIEHHLEETKINEDAFKIEIEDSESEKCNSESKNTSHDQIKEFGEEAKKSDSEDDEQIKPHDLGNEEGCEPNQLPEELKENKIDKNSNENLNKENEIDNNPVKGHLLKTRPVDPILTNDENKQNEKEESAFEDPFVLDDSD